MDTVDRHRYVEDTEGDCLECDGDLWGVQNGRDNIDGEGVLNDTGRELKMVRQSANRGSHHTGELDQVGMTPFQQSLGKEGSREHAMSACPARVWREDRDIHTRRESAAISSNSWHFSIHTFHRSSCAELQIGHPITLKLGHN